jgi:hypothetical protein
MEKEFVPYTLALRLKALGFDEPCLAYYSILEIQRIGEHNLHYTQRGKEILRENDWSWVYRNFPKFRKYLKAEHCYKYSTNSSKLIASAPTWQSAFRWFREKYDLHHVIHQFTFKKGTDEEYLAEVGKADDTFSECRTYEDAEVACLEKLIEIIEEKQK